MAATRITALPAAPSLDYNNDVFPIVDVSATTPITPTGTTSKATLSQVDAVLSASGNKAIVVDNVAALKALTVSGITDGQLYITRGYYSDNDGGQGTYIYDTASAATDNGGTVIAPTAGAGRFLLQYSGPVNVKQFGAKGDSAADDYQSFSNAITEGSGKSVFVPNTSLGYKIGTGTLSIPANTKLYGESMKSSKLIHSFNGTMFSLGSGCTVCDILIDGNGATYTGGCFDYSGTNSQQTVYNVTATNFDGPIQNFSVAAGSQSSTYNCLFSRTNASTGTNRYAVVISSTQQLSATPRKFVNIETGGTCSFDLGGCNNTYISNSCIGDLKYTSNTRGCLISSTRILNQAALTISGFNNTISSCDIAPQITISSGSDNIAIEGNSFNNLPVIDLSGNGRNLVSFFPTTGTTYIPTLTTGGVAPSLGNGSITGVVSRSGNIVKLTIELTLGSTTSFGTGDIRFSLPTFAPNSNWVTQSCGNALMSIGGVNYFACVQIPPSTQFIRLIRDTTASVTFNSPAVFSSGDFIRISCEYQM